MTLHPKPKPEPPAATRRTHTSNDWRDLPVEDVMQTDVVTVPASSPLSEVATVLTENRISGLPVTDEGGNVVGVLSLRDLVDRYAEDPEARLRQGSGFYHLYGEELEDEDLEMFVLPPADEETAGDLMTRQVLAVTPTASLREVAREMVRRNVHRLLVSTDKHMVGIVSTMDLLRAAAR